MIYTRSSSFQKSRRLLPNGSASFSPFKLLAFIFFCGIHQLWAGTLTGSFIPVAAGSNVELTAIGKLDWVHWGLYTDSSVNRKSCTAAPISDFTLLGDTNCTNCFLTEYQYSDNANGYSWHDGVPVSSVTNTTTGIWAYNYPVPIGSGFQLTVPADKAPKTLLVYVGAFEAAGQLTASLSDGGSFTSLPNATVDNFTNGPGGVFTLNFAANSTGQVLTVTWKVQTIRGIDANVTLQAAALTAANANNPPFVVITTPVNNATFAEPASITIQADARDFDGWITSVSFYRDTYRLLQIISTNGPYMLTWSPLARGHYTLTAYATDNSNAVSCAQPVEVFVYGSGGGQTNSVAFPPSANDLTSEGTADWAHWGLATNTSFDHKSLAQQTISNFTALGTNAIEQFSDNYTAFSWSDGTPTPSATNTTTGVFVTGVTNGFRLTAPANTQPQQLNVYVGGYGVQGVFEAYLSDFSAPPYTDTSISNVYGTSYALYSVAYTAASTNQQLIVVYRSLNLFDLAYGNVALSSATLAVGQGDMLPVYLSNPIYDGNNFSFSFVTQSNFSYAVQCLASLPSTNWTTVTDLAGTGGTVSVTNQNGNGEQKYYRVQTH